jgi:hypothetical protein
VGEIRGAHLYLSLPEASDEAMRERSDVKRNRRSLLDEAQERSERSELSDERSRVRREAMNSLI